MAINTTRNDSGGVVTTTEAPGYAGSDGRNPVLDYLLQRRKIEDERADLEYAKSKSPMRGSSVRGKTEMPSPRGGSNYSPQMGQGQMPRNVTRSIPNPFVSPYHKMATGQDIPTIQERYLDGIGWEFDGAVQGRGSGGGRGEISFRDTAPTPSQQPQAPSLTYGQTQWGIVPTKKDKG